MERYFKFVDAAANEMGKMPVLCDMLVQGLELYPKKVGKKLEIIPFGKVLNNYCTDYLVAAVEVSSDGKRILSLILYELKQDVAAHLASVCENDLAQAMVEGYYALLGCDVDLSSMHCSCLNRCGNNPLLQAQASNHKKQQLLFLLLPL